MTARLINVRLDDARLRKARALRRHGVVLSDLVREAIDTKFDDLDAKDRSRDVKGMIASLYERYPDPPDLPPRDYDVHDRRASRAAIRARLSRKHR